LSAATQRSLGAALGVMGGFANEEQAHADPIAARIVQLQGEPNFSPEGLASRAHAARHLHRELE
jgi:bacterioferritin (cytochrome b1)